MELLSLNPYPRAIVASQEIMQDDYQMVLDGAGFVVLEALVP